MFALRVPCPQTQDPELKGHVVLTLPTRRAVTGIKVVLEGICDVWGTLPLSTRAR